MDSQTSANPSNPSICRVPGIFLRGRKVLSPNLKFIYNRKVIYKNKRYTDTRTLGQTLENTQTADRTDSQMDRLSDVGQSDGQTSA